MWRHLLAFTALSGGWQSPTVIHSSVRLVQVNVVVHDKNGPVANLTKDDFVLTERGKRLPISVFSVDSAGAGTRGAEALPQNTFSNRPSGAGTPNITIVLFDGLNTKFEDQAFAKQEILKFLKTVDPKDRIAIYTLGRTLRVLCDFTDSPDELQKVLASFRGSAGALVTGDTNPATTGNAVIDEMLEESNRLVAAADAAERARSTIAAFSAIAGHVTNLPGRKNLLWVTSSLPHSLAEAARAFNRANLAVYPVDARGLVGVPGSMLPSLPTPKYHGGPPAMPNFRPDGLQTMQDLADLTGGRAFYNNNDLSGTLRSALDDSAVTYTLGCYPDSETLDGKFHELKVDVARAGLNVRYRTGYVALKERQASEESDKHSLAAALASPIESASIPMSAKIQRRKGALIVALSMDAHNLQLTEEGAFSDGAVNIFFVQQDETGKFLDRAEAPIALHLTKEQCEAYLRN
jgi:VWFA-related protein